MEAAAWGMVGTLVGAMASIGTTWLSSRSTYKLQSEKLAEERIERAKAFQRETLLALQEALHDALRINARAHHEDLMAHRRTGEWGRALLSDEVNEGLRLAHRRVFILTDRISEEDLRSSVKALMALAAEGRAARGELEAEMNLKTVIQATAPVFESIGAVLRAHY